MKTLIKKTNIQEVKEHLLYYGINPKINTLNDTFSTETRNTFKEMIFNTRERTLINAMRDIKGTNDHALNDDFHITKKGEEKKLKRQMNRGIEIDKVVYNNLDKVVLFVESENKNLRNIKESIITSILRNRPYRNFTSANGMITILFK